MTQINQENEQHLKQQAQKHLLDVVRACERIHAVGLAFYNDLHMSNICLDETSQQYVFVDVEEFQRVSPHLTFLQARKKACKFLVGQQLPLQKAFQVFKELIVPFGQRQDLCEFPNSLNPYPLKPQPETLKP